MGLRKRDWIYLKKFLVKVKTNPAYRVPGIR